MFPGVCVLRGPRPNESDRVVGSEFRREGSRWRRDQRRRRARLTRRGRATVVTCILTATGPIVWAAVGPGPASTAPVSATAVAAPALGSPEPALSPPGLFARLPVTRAALALPRSGATEDAPAGGRFYESFEDGAVPGAAPGPIRVEYTLDAELMEHVFRVLRRGRVDLGHVVLMDPDTGRVHAYASTDVGRFPPTRTYPAASLVKIITAAAAIDLDPRMARLPCRFRGSPYRLTPSRIDPPRRGTTVSLRKALATSNNQCFAQLAVHAVGGAGLLGAIDRFGWLSEPAPAHAAGSVEVGDDRYGIGKLGCGLSGCRITPLHAVQLAAALAHGERVAPRWIDRVVDADGRELPLPALPEPRRVMSRELAAELREMLVDTTTRGTARSAFRGKRGRRLLHPLEVAGKTGSLSGTAPDGRYEWFIGVAPADDPRIAISVLLVQGHLWWKSASRVAAEVLEGVFCERGRCRADAFAPRQRWTRATAAVAKTAPALN